ncbi:hypothetical protein KIN20_010695 [Parelaphostrongylus tenuis]|nr:hypothetical protein KIN20_010695 [Parelaphostrongylus tenuis]
MAYSTAPDVPPQASGIATSAEGARRFVDRLIMQTVFDVLQSQGRSALLPDAVISAILSQLTMTVTYTPLMCPKLRIGVEDPERLNAGESACIIVDGTVTAICSIDAGPRSCAPVPAGGGANGPKITPVPDPHLTISGSLSTTNIIMASWSRAMWQSVVNRAIRMLALGPFRRHFFSATATVGRS